MKKYTLEYRSRYGGYCFKTFMASDDRNAQYYVMGYMSRHYCSNPWIYDFNGNYIPVL